MGDPMLLGGTLAFKVDESSDQCLLRFNLRDGTPHAAVQGLRAHIALLLPVGGRWLASDVFGPYTEGCAEVVVAVEIMNKIAAMLPGALEVK
jgi:hypothetical protein